MRLSCRFFSLLRMAFLLLLLGIPCSASWGQTPSQQSAQLPTKWNDAVRSLAEKIAAAAAPSHAIALQVKNISALSSTEASAIQAALKIELERRNFHVTSDSASERQVDLTLSEGYADLVWVAEIRQGETEQTVMDSVPKGLGQAGQFNQPAVALQKTFIWEQSVKMLDFVILPSDPSDAPSSLVVLEPDRLAEYRYAEAHWQFDQSIPIPREKPWARDLSGSIDLNARTIHLADVKCSGELGHLETVSCNATSSSDESRSQPPLKLPGSEVGDAIMVGLACGGTEMALATGTGDWTQPDSIQGYEIADGQSTASGIPLETDGPVTSLESAGMQGKARVVIHNLKKGNYDAYIVTATCSH